MNPTQPPLPDLFARYLARQASAHEQGLGFADPADEVVPFDAVPVQPVEPRLAWAEAVAALRHPGAPADPHSLMAPPEWPALVAAHEPEVALPLCLGNFPQLVRHLPALMHATRLGAPPAAEPPAAPPALLEWAARQRGCPQALLAAGVLRLARQFDAAAGVLGGLKDVPAAWRPALANEEAALAWHRGDAAQAAAHWAAQADSVPVLFNRGMAALFLGRPAEARASLSKAAAALAEDDAWHHLARLYLALAEMRG